MSVESVNPLYEKRRRQWEIMRDCIEGEDAVKEKGEKYLPRPSGKAPEWYESYKKRARFINYTGRTLSGLHGLMFRRYPVLECSDEFRFSGIVENVDRRGTNLNQFVCDSVRDIMTTSFGGFLVDMPSTEGEITLEEAEKRGIKPYVRYYPAESIINWKYSIVDGVERLSLVVLKEAVEGVVEDEFAHKIVWQYRVLQLKDGVYSQRLFKRADKVWEEVFIPIVVNGQQKSYIPFVFAPADVPERPMLLDLAWCNIGHYQKSADYENGVHLTTIPTGYVTGHRQNEDEDTGEKEIVNLGDDSFLMFEEPDAKVGTLVFSGAGLLHSETALSQAMSEMAVLGSRLVSPDKNVSETADAAKIHRAGENALLATFAKNVSERITRVLNIVNDWCGYEGWCDYELSTDYDTLSFDANALNALANLATNNKMPLPYLYFNLANGEYLPSDSSLEEYVTMLQMEQDGEAPIDVVRHYRNVRSGKTERFNKTESDK